MYQSMQKYSSRFCAMDGSSIDCMIFSVVVYGRFWSSRVARFFPIPGSASSVSLGAVLMSSG